MMSNENNDLVIFEYEAFEKRLKDCALSLPAWAPIIQACIDKYKGEENLNQLVEELTSEAHPQSTVIATWNETSKNVADHSESIDDLIRSFERRNLLSPSKQPLVYLLDALNTLILYSSSSLSGMNLRERKGMQTIYSTLKTYMEELMKGNPDLVRLMAEDVHPDADTKTEQSEVPSEVYSQEITLQNLQKKFNEELAYIAKSDETDNIFRDVKKISNEIIPDLVKMLGPIVGSERFHSDRDTFLKELERGIEGFIFRAQSNINKQINSALESVREEFQDTLQLKIRPQLQLVSSHLALFVSTEQQLRKVREDMKDWQDRIEAFIGEFVQLPDDIKQSCENFCRDFECLAALKTYEQNGKIPSGEVETLKHLFGFQGTSVFKRLKLKSEDLSKSENAEEILDYGDEIRAEYQYRLDTLFAHSETLGDHVLSDIFRHALDRLEHIEKDVMEEIHE
jgi:hypothetical protein